ncbi:MAG TPA: glycine oxidase ThiO [Pyrinomonadaceae bacterium]|nr:glycine oxidase ThiO [Pyrinomonadaceae bacterium]
MSEAVHTLQPNENADVVIVGGGVIGLMIARELAQQNVDVMVIERGSLGAEASHAAGGILGPQAEADCADDFFELASQSRDCYPALAVSLFEQTGIDIELDTTGTLYLAFTEKDETEIEERFDWQARAGLAVSKLSSDDVRSLEPIIAQNVRASLYFPRDIQVDNRKLIAALIAANQKLGVRLITWTDVQSLEVEGGRITGVMTAQGGVSSNRLVLAAGAWTNMISTGNDLSEMQRVRIEPVRGQMVCLQTNPRATRHILYSPRGYLVPRRDGRLLCGSTTEHAGFTKEVTPEGIANILTNAHEIAPAVDSFPMASTWAGLRPRAEDGLPVIGPAGIDGLFYATGHYRNGILLAPITAELIAEAIMNDSAPPMLNPFTPDRFILAGAH